MTIETCLAFVAASTILLVIPGPTVLLVVSYALGQGWRAALPMAVGVALGDFAAMTLSYQGSLPVAVGPNSPWTAAGPCDARFTIENPRGLHGLMRAHL